MPLVSPNWQPEVPPSTSTSATITKVEIETTTVVNMNSNPYVLSKNRSTDLWATESWHLLLLLIIPVIWWLRRQRAKRSEAEKDSDLAEEDWQRAWKTKHWNVLYGLMTLAHDNNSQHTPFRDKYVQSIRKRWNQYNRVSLKRLLERGIIPLYIQDGGVTTEQIKPWSWSNHFPYVRLPLYRQAKKRAYFEFLVPYPYEEKRKAFLQKVINNVHRYGVTLRISEPPPGPGKIENSEMNPPCFSEDEPFSMGAESVLELLLPFKEDRILEKAHTGRIHQLRWFLKGLDSERVPLFHHAESVLVRVESRHWGHVELDPWIFYLAQEVNLEICWPAEVTREAAKRELKRCGAGS